MSTNLTWQTQLDKPLWIPEATALAATAAGVSMACDLRNNNTRVPLLFELINATTLGVYNPMLTDWLQLASPALTGTFGAGATCVFHPTLGADSKLLAGSTATTLNLDGFGNGAPAAATWTRVTTTATVTTTANHGFQTGQILTVTVTSDATAIVLGNVTITVTGNTTYTFTCLNAGAASGTLTVGISIGIGVLGNKGDGVGFVIRVIDNGAGGSGKTEEAFISTNTSGATPVVTLASALSFTPVTGSSFELLSGRLFMLSAGTTALGCWKYYDVASNTFSGNLSITNLPATISSDSSAIAMSELYVSSDRTPSTGQVNGGATYNNGRFNCIQATAAAASTITGSGMPATLFADEYRNFQVRIVEDTVTPTSVGQRVLITSHTGGATGVFTISGTFSVTPSSSAKFVVENFDAWILANSSANASVYTYNTATNAWSTTTFSAGGAVVGSGNVLALNSGIPRDPTGNSRQSFVYRVLGGASNTISVLDIAGAATGSWSNTIMYSYMPTTTFTTGTCGIADPINNSGRYLYLNINGTQRFARFDMADRVMLPCFYMRFPQSTAVVGQKTALGLDITGSYKTTGLYTRVNSAAQMLSVVIQDLS